MGPFGTDVQQCLSQVRDSVKERNESDRTKVKEGHVFRILESVAQLESRDWPGNCWGPNDSSFPLTNMARAGSSDTHIVLDD